MSVELSDRMQAVVNLVSECEAVTDVGCDHGYVAIWLVQNRKCNRVIAMDINKGPLESARKNIALYGLSDYIETRLSNGVQALKEGEVSSLVCAGMGGKLTIQILEDGRNKIRFMKELVLQPQSDLQEVRKYIRQTGMKIIAEDMVCDAEKYYPMMKIAVNPGIEAEQKTEWEQRIEDTYGPLLLQMAHPVLLEFLKKRIHICMTIKMQLQSQQNANDRQQKRIEEIQQEIDDINIILKKYF